MSDILATLAQSVARNGGQMIAGLLGAVVGGPLGAAVGGMAGKVLEELAGSLGTEPTPAAVAKAVAENPAAPQIIREVEAKLPDLLPLWQAQLAMASQAQTAEIEKGFGSWNWRRSVAHYTTWGLTGGIGAAAAVAFFTGNPGAAGLAGLFGSAMTLTMAWLAVNSGGKAVADFAKEWKAR